MDNITFFDQRPSHPQRPPILCDAAAASDEAWDNYLAAIDRVYAEGRQDTPTDDEYEELRKLMIEATEAGSWYLALYDKLNAPARVFDIDQTITNNTIQKEIQNV